MKPNFEVAKGSQSFRQCVGIDVAKKKFNACLCMYDTISGNRCYSKSVEFSNDKTGFNQMVKWSRKEGLKEFPMSYLMEPTGVHYEPLAYHLAGIKQTVYVVLPNKVRNFCNYEGIKTKTDEIDSKCLALLGCKERSLRPWSPPKTIYRELRQMTRFVEEIEKIRTMIVNHLEALNHSASAEKSVKKYYVKLVADIDKQLKDNEVRMREKIDTDKELSAKVKKLCTVKGLGLMTVATIIAETNGFALITNRKQLASFAGLDVKANQSGPEDPKRHITKKGNTHIRRVLYFPAMSSTRFNPQMKEMYKRICECHDVKKVGITAIMRKLLLLTYTLWKSGEEYDEKRNGKIKTIEERIEDILADYNCGIQYPATLNPVEEATRNFTVEDMQEVGLEMTF